jgi:epoxyqueuosine reductase
VLIAIGNSDDASLADAAENLLGDDSALVRAAAVWALSQLIAKQRFETLASKAMACETDETVRAEWQQASCAAGPLA